MRRILVLVTLAWVGVTLGAALVAVDRRIPYDLAFLDGRGAADRVGEDWLYGWGTGLAAPLVMVAAAAVLAVTSSLSGAAGRFGAFLLGVLGGLSLTYTLSNQVTADLLVSSSSEPVETLLVIATMSLAALMVVVGFTSWLTAPRERYF